MDNVWNYLLLARRMAVMSAPVILVKLLKQCLKAQIQNVAPICPLLGWEYKVRCKLESWSHLSERGVVRVPGGGRGRPACQMVNEGTPALARGVPWRPQSRSVHISSSLLLPTLSNTGSKKIPPIFTSFHSTQFSIGKNSKLSPFWLYWFDKKTMIMLRSKNDLSRKQI